MAAELKFWLFFKPAHFYIPTFKEKFMYSIIQNGRRVALLIGILSIVYFTLNGRAEAAQKSGVAAPDKVHAWAEKPSSERIVGGVACAECHEQSFELWKETHHSTTFREMPRDPRAREIADKLGIQRIKTDALCLSCHYTSMASDTGKVKPISGISCESCHGAAKDWMAVHYEYGEGMTKETEPDEHRINRVVASEAAGMLRPERIYAWASNCYNCHTVPQEELVNVGGHPAGSKFELVSWSQGEVRHNVWFSGGENVEASAEHRRMLYVTGQLLDLAYGLRGLSKATTKAPYAITMAKRSQAALLRLKKVAEVVTVAEVGEVLAITEGVELKLNNQEPLEAAAEKVAALAKQFSEAHDGSEFAALDALIPPAENYKGMAEA